MTMCFTLLYTYFMASAPVRPVELIVSSFITPRACARGKVIGRVVVVVVVVVVSTKIALFRDIGV